MSGKRAKRERREGTREIKEHKPVRMDLGNANFAHDRKLYWERRKHGVSGSIKAPRVYERVEDENGETILLPSSANIPPGSSRLERKGSGKSRDGRFTTKGHAKFVQAHQQKRAAGRGE